MWSNISCVSADTRDYNGANTKKNPSLSKKEKQRQQEEETKNSAFSIFRGTHTNEENTLKEEIGIPLIFEI